MASIIETPVQAETSAMDIATSRSAQEIQAAMVIAKKFPRDEMESLQRIVRSCQRKGLAEVAMYAYPRGGQKVEGPSIRLAEALAQGWGNIDYGVIELEQRYGESSCMAYAWDLETNTRSTKIFTVKHERSKRDGNVTLTDPRDIYEMVANQGARRMRNCILAVIPGDVQDQAVIQCNKTLQGNGNEPISDRVSKMAMAFKELGVTRQMIQKRLGHRFDAVTETQLVELRKIYQSIKDGMSDRSQWFDLSDEAPKSASSLDELAERFSGKEGEQEPKKPAKKPKGKKQEETEPEADGEPSGELFEAHPNVD